MFEDILTMVWKERKGIFRVRGSRSRFLLMLMSPVLFAVVFPWQWGPDWVEEIPPLAIAVLVAVLINAVMIPESFAGERERHTLGTLLASRLPDRAILLGKLITPIALGWGIAILTALLSLVTVNVAHWSGEFLFFSLPIALGSVLLSFLMAVLTAGVGVFISLRAATAQEATQMLTAIILIPPMLLQMIPLLFRDQMGQWIEAINGPQLLTIVIVVLAVVDVAVMLAAVARFQRSRLALN
jgi:ABC-2 type transport system permease protein